MSVRSAIAELRAHAASVVTLSGESSHHLCRVLRLGKGDRFVAFDPQTGEEADATIEDASGDAARVSLGTARAGAVVAVADVALIYGLAKGDKVDSVVRDATELGVTRIFIVRTVRAVAKADGDRAGAKLERWRRIAEQAARQCGRADPPRIEGVLDWKAALEAASNADARYCLWENATAPLGALLVDDLRARRSLAFAIGPEGGLSEDEVAQAGALGFITVSLGPFILRTETAPAAVLGAVRILAQLA